MDGNEQAIHLTLRVKMMKMVIKWAGFWKDQFSENVWHWGGQAKGQQPGEDLVLDHIILDLTGDSVPLEQIADASVQREFKRKKRLLRQSNTVLFSRLGIMALVAVMLVVTTLLTWYFTSTYGARSVKSLAVVLRQQLLRASTQAMVSVLGEVYNGTVVLASLHQQVFYSTPNATWENVEPRLRWVNRAVFDSQRQYTSVAYVAADGRLTDFTRSATADYLFFVNVSSNATNAVWYWQDVTGYLNESLAPPPTVKISPYPVSAGNVLSLEPLEVYWTIAPNSLGEAVVSPAVPFQDLVTRVVVGVATITSTFQFLNTYLATLDLLGGYVYFEWHNGTGNSSIVAFSYGGTTDILASPYNASNLVVRSAAYYLSDRYGYRMPALEQTHDEDVSLMGQKYYIDTVRLGQSPFDALNLTAIMILPRSAIMGRIDKRNQTVIHVIVGTAVGILVFGCCLICFLTRKMSTEMQLRQELIRLLVGKHRAEQSSNYKSQFLANMSHELRTPIAGIIGLLDLLSCDSLTSEQVFSVSQIRRCATGLLSLVNNVLDISKVEAGRMELEVAPFRVADELESLVDMFAAQSVGSGIDLVLDMSDNTPAFVRGDSIRIRQIFSNLLSNSLKFTTHGHILVRGWVDQALLEPNGKQQDFSHLLSGRERVSGPILHSSLEDQLCLVFEVEDSGCGIAPELHEKVFDSFVQADSSTTRTHGGSGLGLYIVRSLVELMGGEVAVVPNEAQGTVVRFHIIVERASDPMPVHRASVEGSQALGSPTEHDGFDSLLGSPFDQFEPSSRSLPEGLERTRVLLAMQAGVSRNVAIAWLERSGLRVTCVDAWGAVIPCLEHMSKSSNLIETQSATKFIGTDDPGGGRMGSLAMLPGMHSRDSSSSSGSGSGSENALEFANFASVLALIDVTLLPGMKVDFDRKLFDPGAVGENESNVSNLSRAEVEKLPSPMQEMLDGMLRVQHQRSVAISWLVAPDCGAKWKQALQADGSFLVLNKPLHGSRLRRLLAFLARSGKYEPHHWEVLDNSLFGSPLSPMPRTTPRSTPKDLKSSNLRDDYHRRPPDQIFEPMPSRRSSSARQSTDQFPELMSSRRISNARPSTDRIPELIPSRRTSSARKSTDQNPELHPSRRTSSARKSTDQEPLYNKPETLARDSTGMQSPRVSDAHSTITNVHPRGEPSVPSASQIGPGNHPKSISPDVPRKSQSDNTTNPFVQGKTFDRASSQSTPSNGLHKYQNAPLVEIPYLTDESRRLLGTSTPESPLSGQSTPGHVIGMGGRSIREIGTPDVSDLRKNSAQVRDAEDEWGESGATLGVGGKQSAVSGGGNVGQTSHEKPERRSGMGPYRPASAFTHKSLSGMHILLVEDTAVLQRLVSMTLKKLGASVTVVGDGLQAVTAVADAVEATRDPAPSHYDLILMDCAMPVMDGYNATMAIREAEENTARHIPIVALTAHALVSDKERCLSVGMDAYLTKPIDCKLMVTTIRGLLSKGTP